MTTTIDIRDLPGRLDEALALASEGGEVILLDGAVPLRPAYPFTIDASADRRVASPGNRANI